MLGSRASDPRGGHAYICYREAYRCSCMTVRPVDAGRLQSGRGGHRQRRPQSVDPWSARGPMCSAGGRLLSVDLGPVAISTTDAIEQRSPPSHRSPAGRAALLVDPEQLDAVPRRRDSPGTRNPEPHRRGRRDAAPALLEAGILTDGKSDPSSRRSVPNGWICPPGERQRHKNISPYRWNADANRRSRDRR